MRIFLARLRLTLGCTIAACALAAAIAFMLPDRYEAVVTIELVSRADKIANSEGALADLKGVSATVDGEVEIIRSHEIALKVIDQLKLRDDTEFAQQPPWRQWYVTLGLGALEQDSVERALKSQIQAKRISHSNLIEIYFSSSRPERAAQIVNAIADVYIHSQLDAKSRATEIAGELLEERLKGLREKVAAGERDIESLKSETGSVEADGRLVPERQIRLETEALANARGQTTVAKARHDAARRMMLEGEGSGAIADVVQSSNVRPLREELAKALQREAELGTKHGASHPERQRIAADIAKVQSELAAEIVKIAHLLKGEHAAALDREHQIEQRIAALKRHTSTSKYQHWNLRELEREVTASRQLLEALVQSNKQTEETLGMQLPDARLAMAAAVPELPSSPNRARLVIGATIAGLLLGLGLAFVVEFKWKGFSRAEQIEDNLQVPLLSSLPLLNVESGEVMEQMRMMRQMIADPSGMYAQCVRTLCHGLDAVRADGAPAVVIVTSSVEGEANSVTASNVALHYAITGRRTLLIDADMRRRGVTRGLSLTGRPGLLEVLAQGMPIDNALLLDKSTGLYVMTAAARSDRRIAPVELLDGNGMTAMLQALRQEFDTIVIDAPPMLAERDTHILAVEADHIVMLARWRDTPRLQVRRALNSLGVNARKVAGVALVNVPGGGPSGRLRNPSKRDPGRQSHDLRRAA